MIFPTSMIMFHVNLPGCSMDGPAFHFVERVWNDAAGVRFRRSTSSDFCSIFVISHIHVYNNNNSNWFSMPTTCPWRLAPRVFFWHGFFHGGNPGIFLWCPHGVPRWCWCRGICLAFRVIVFVQRPCQTDARRPCCWRVEGPRRSTRYLVPPQGFASILRGKVSKVCPLKRRPFGSKH